MTTDNVTTVRPGDRIDLIAARTLGDPYLYGEIIEANPFLDIWDPKPGDTVVIPDVKRSS